MDSMLSGLTGWARAEAIKQRIVRPAFPDRDFSLLDFGADPRGRSDSTEAIRKAVAACHAGGGGRVVVPAGVYRTAAIRLLSNVNLHLRPGAEIRFSTDPAAYLPLVLTRWQGVELYHYSPLIYAFEQENVAITGSGTLNGQADDDHWWPWVERQEDSWPLLWRLADDGIPVERRVFGSGHPFRPNFIEPYRCRNVLIEGVRIVGSPMWEIHPTLCESVTVENVTIDTRGPNNDGCDPESCRYVLIKGCTITAGDDSIALKSGREADGLRVGVPCEDVVIEDCDLRFRYGAVTIGSDMTGGVRNVFVRDCRIGGPGLYFGLYIKTNSVRGGFAENVYLKDITVTQLTKEFVTCDFLRSEGDTGTLTPVVRNVQLENITVGRARRALLLRGYQRSPIRDVTLTNCVFGSMEESNIVEHVEGMSG